MIIKNKWRLSQDDMVARLVLFPTVLLSAVCVYGFIIYTIYISFTGSTIMPVYEWVGLENYAKLWQLRHWHIAIKNMAIFGVLYIGISTVLGLILAILIDLNRMGEIIFRPIFLYPWQFPS